MAQRHFGFAGIDALDDFFDRLVLDDEVADIDSGENLADQIARRDAGAVEAQAAGHFIKAFKMQRRRAAVAVWCECRKILLESSEARALVAVAEDEFDLFGAEELFFEAGERAVVEDGAAIDDHDAATKFFDVVEIVRGEKNRSFVALVDGAEELANVVLSDNVEADGGLIEKKDGWIVEQCGGEIAAHALAKRKFANGNVEQILEPEDLVEEFHAFVVVALRDIVDAAQKFEGFDGRDVPPELRPLAEDDADGFYVGGSLFPGDEPVGQNFTGGRHQDAGEHFDGGGFAGAVGADVADHFAAADFKIYVFDGFDALVFAMKKIAQAAEDAFAPLETAVMLGEGVDRDEGSVGHERVILARGGEKTGAARFRCG